MDVSHFTGGSSLCKNTMVFSAEQHLGYLPPIRLQLDDTISDSIPACLFRNVFCLPVGVIVFCCACSYACIDIGTDCAVPQRMCTSVLWWGSHTIWCRDRTPFGLRGVQ